MIHELHLHACDGSSLRIVPHPGSFAGASAFADAAQIDAYKIAATYLSKDTEGCRRVAHHLRGLRRQHDRCDFPNAHDLGEMFRSALRKNDRMPIGTATRAECLEAYQRTCEFAAAEFLRELASLPPDVLARIIEAART